MLNYYMNYYLYLASNTQIHFDNITTIFRIPCIDLRVILIRNLVQTYTKIQRKLLDCRQTSDLYANTVCDGQACRLCFRKFPIFVFWISN